MDKNAMRLNPYHPERFWSHLGRAYFVAHRYDEAIEAFKRIATLDYTHHAFLAASFAQMDDVVVARNHAEVVIREEATFTVSGYLETLHYGHDTDREHHREALSKAGLPP